MLKLEVHNWSGDSATSTTAQRGIAVTGWTKILTRAQVEKAFGERLKTFETCRMRFDPTGRMLNDYCRALFSL